MLDFPPETLYENDRLIIGCIAKQKSEFYD